jgi:Protein of unknown function (DUF1822)
MNNSTKNIREKAIPLPITTAALRLAQQFSNLDEVTTPEKKEQVYFNTLAVCAVKDYMEMMDIPTDLNASDSWNPAMRLYTDAADLKLTELGHLECRLVKDGEFCDIPLDIPDDRIGVVAVEIDTNRQEATLLGFTATASAGELAIDKLQSFDKFLEYLDYLECRKKTVQLRQWLHHIFEVGWEAVEDILVPKEPNLAFRYRNAIVRGKIVALTADISEPVSATIDCFQPKSNLCRGVREIDRSVALLVAIEPTTDAETKIKVQVHPATGADSLPLNLILQVIDGEGMTVMEACAGSGNGCMTLEFTADREECFSVVIKLKDLCIAENFAA